MVAGGVREENAFCPTIFITVDILIEARKGHLGGGMGAYTFTRASFQPRMKIRGVTGKWYYEKPYCVLEL